ncbi:hypothetical protein PXQ17_001556 [Vibrio parahaemolyticus]|nr:hypothetical protein [Vibrio parahaemolyticus]
MKKNNKYTLIELKSIIEASLAKECTKPESIQNLYKKYLSLRKTDTRMPVRPEKFYAKSDWKSYRDLFGLPKIEFYTIEELKTVIQANLSLEGTEPQSISSLTKKYKFFREQDNLIPSDPSTFYAKAGWKSYRDLFNLPNIEFYTFKELKLAIKKALKREGTTPESIIGHIQSKYLSLRNKDPRMPSSPNVMYNKTGWKSYYDLFDLPNEGLYTLEELKVVIKNALKHEELTPESLIGQLQAKYQSLREKDNRIPSSPSEIYAKTGWEGLRNLFDLPNIAFYTIEELKSAIKKALEQEGTKPESIIGHLDEIYQSLRKKDNRIPSNPNVVYAKTGWEGLRNLFNLPDIAPYTIEELKSAIKKALEQEGIKPESIGQLANKYQSLRKKDSRMPATPNFFYANTGWKSYYNLFDLPKITLYTFEELKSAIQKALEQQGIDPQSIRPLSIKYKSLRKNDTRMPKSPNITYAKTGWKNYRDLFGLSESAWYSYHEAQNTIQVYLKKNNINLYNYSLSDLFSLIARDDPKMPSSPDKTYADHWLGLEYFFQRNTFYSFEKAHQIAKAKGTTKSKITVLDYERLRLENPMFPPSPERAYLGKWRTVQHFFGASDGRYEQLIDAQRAAIEIAKKLRITITSRTYPDIAKHDPRLPPSIERYKPYQGQWHGWKEFAGTMKYDLIKAREIAVQNGWLTSKEYEKAHSSDIKLPAEPVRYYGLGSYAEFIEFRYWDIKQVKNYCTENKISTAKDYVKHAHRIVHLRVRYHEIEGFTKANDFLYKPRPFEQIEDLGFEQWAELSRQYLNGHAKRGFSTKISHINHFLRHLISKNALPYNPFELFIAGNHIEPLEPLLERVSDGKYLESTVIDFVKFVMNDCCYDRDEDTGELISINPEIHFRHPYQYLNVEFESKSRPIQTVKPPLDFVYIEAAKQYLIPDFVHDVNGNRRPCSTFSDLTDAHLLFDSDWFEVDEDTYQGAIDDPNCVTKTETVTKKIYAKIVKHKIYKIWSPVRAIEMYVLFSLPLRGIQICYLDSGEADDYKLIEQDDGNLIWVVNDNPLASHLGNKGFLHREIGDSIGMNISTNKTSKHEGGYTVPWMPLDVAKWVIRLRDWQTKYNPLRTPTPWSDITTPAEIHQKILKKRGSQCFLFRDPRDSIKRNTNPPGSQPFLPNPAFSAFEKLLYLIQNDDMPLAQIKKGKSGGADTDYQSIYSPHTLRVSHISALLFEGDGLDPAIVQKLVGHANLVMTIYYGVINSEQMRDKLTGQYKEIAANKQKQYQASLLSRNIEEAKGELIFLSNGAGQVAWENSAIRFKDCGMCPVANGRCDEGGPPINPGSKTLIYSRAKSCYQCRFFVTGPAFMGGLLAKFNEINVAKKRASNRIESLGNKKKRTRLKRKQAEDQQKPTDNIKLDLEQINTAIDAEQVKFYSISADQGAIFRKVLSCIHKINDATSDEKDTNGVALILNRDEAEVGISLDESSDFRMLAEVCEDAQIYDSIDDSEAVIQREKFLDTMLKENGFDAIFFQLDEDQSRYIGNQMQKLLLNRLKSWKSVDNLIYGDMRLSDLTNDNNSNLQNIKEELSLIIKNANDEVSYPYIQQVEG